MQAKQSEKKFAITLASQNYCPHREVKQQKKIEFGVKENHYQTKDRSVNINRVCVPLPEAILRTGATGQGVPMSIWLADAFAPNLEFSSAGRDVLGS